jgi:hypothetical protein
MEDVMIGFLFFVSLCLICYGWSTSRRARRNRDRAEAMLRRAGLERVLEGAVAALPTIQRHQVRTLPTSDARRVALVHEMLRDLEERDVLASAEIETALLALDIAAGRSRCPAPW